MSLDVISALLSFSLLADDDDSEGSSSLLFIRHQFGKLMVHNTTKEELSFMVSSRMARASNTSNLHIKQQRTARCNHIED